MIKKMYLKLALVAFSRNLWPIFLTLSVDEIDVSQFVTSQHRLCPLRDPRRPPRHRGAPGDEPLQEQGRGRGERARSRSLQVIALQ